MARWVGVLPIAARTADTNSPIIVNHGNYHAMHLSVDITAGAPNLVVTVQGKASGTDKYYNLLQSSTINSGNTVLKIGSDYTAGTNVAKDYIPYEWRVAVTQSGGVSATYSIGASLI